MSFFKELKIDRKVETCECRGEAAQRLLYTLCHCIDDEAMALFDKDEIENGPWVAVNDAWIDLVGWTVDDLNERIENPFHLDDFDIVIEHNHSDLASCYAVRIRKKGKEKYKWYKIDAFSFAVNGHRFRICILEKVV